MSKRKTNQRRKLAKERNKNCKERKKELEELKSKVIQLELKIAEQKKENLKQLNIRNLKIFANTCNLIAPFIISAGITAGTFNIFGGGLPFRLDKTTKYKVYNMEYQTNGYTSINDEYKWDKWYNDELPTNSLVIYTPWQLQGEKYVRFKRDYNVGRLATLDLFNIVLAEDYKYIIENFDDYKEERQEINKINSEEPNDYFIEASLHILDKENFIEYNETDKKNITITVIEILLSIGIGSITTYFRKFKYLDEIKKVNESYYYKILPTESMEQELKQTNEKILSLTKNRRDKINEK